MTDGSPVPGWYPDPHNAAQLRYWDGVQWTEAVSPTQGAAAEPATLNGPPIAGPTQLAGGPEAPPYQQFQPGGVHQPQFRPGPAHGLGDLGNWLGQTFSVAFSRVVPVLVLLFGVPVAVYVLLTILAHVFLSRLAYDSRTDEFVGFEATPLLLAGAVLILGALLWAVAWLATHHQLHRAHSGRPESLGQSLQAGLRRLPRLVGWGLLYVIGYTLVLVLFVGATALAFSASTTAGVLVLLIIVPLAIAAAVYLWVKLSLFGPAIAVGPRGVNPFATSWRLTESRFWPMFGRLFLLGLIVNVAQYIGGFIPQVGLSASFATLGLETDPATGEILIDGAPVDQLDVIDFGDFLPNLGFLVFIVAVYVAVYAVTYALWVSGQEGLYVRADGPSDLDETASAR